MNKYLLSGIIFLLLLALVSHAAAQQFTFEVPVVLRNLHPEIDSFLVNCTVYDDRLAVAHIYDYGALRERNYTGTVRLALNVLNPASIRRYECTISLHTTRSSGYLSERLILETYGRDPSAPMAFQVGGDIPGTPVQSSPAQTTPSPAQVAPTAISIEPDTDRAGADFFSTSAKNVDACIALCQKEKRCHVFTYYQGNCWLKDGIPKPSPLPGATSGVIRR